jgi:hypothetical protein
MHHTFDIHLANQYGIEEAILIHHFQYWITINSRSNTNYHDGHTWTYQTRKSIQDHFPYMSFDTIRRKCENLIKLGILKTANYNKFSMDKTLWYAFVDEKKFGVDQQSLNNLYERHNCPSKGKTASLKGKIATPIPDTKTNTVVLSCSVKDENLSDSDELYKIDSMGSCNVVHKSDILARSLREKMDWKLPEFKEAWKVLANYPGAVNDPYKFIVGTIRNIRDKNKKNLTKTKSEITCNTKKLKDQDQSKEKSSEKRSRVRFSDLLRAEGITGEILGES